MKKCKKECVNNNKAFSILCILCCNGSLLQKCRKKGGIRNDIKASMEQSRQRS